MTEKRWFSLILTLYILLGITYAIVTPVFEASDELWHYPMARHLADGNPLPVQVFDPAQAGPWKQEASQPPLYYYLGAALTFWIDTSDMADVRLENPHVDNGLITEDGNNNLIVHNPNGNPWQGTLLAVRIIRIFSVLLSVGTVTLTYLIAKQVAPGRPEIALGAAAVNAFLPMFLFISGSVNNDNLAILLASLALFLMIRLTIRQREFIGNASSKGSQSLWGEAGSWLLIGIVIGAGLLTKQGTIGLLPLAWGTTFVYAWQKDKQHDFVQSDDVGNSLLWLVRLFGQSLIRFAILLLPILFIAGWWYWRNVQLYDDILGWSAFVAVLGQRAHPASLAQLWGERQGFLMAYWGLFGGVNVPMPNWIYTVLNSLLLVSIVGFTIYFIDLLRSWLGSKKGTWQTFRSWVDNLLDFVVSNFGLVVCLLFATAVVFGLIRWATTTWSSQGRLVFTALSALSILFTIGIVGWLPKRIAHWAAAIVSTIFLVMAAAAPFLWIAPAYDSESYSPPKPYVLHSQDSIFGETVRLRNVSVGTEEPGISTVKPGDSLWVHLDWELLEPVDTNWSAFVHLMDPVLGQPIAQRDMYLGQGLLNTAWMEPGQRVINSYKLRVPETAVAPSQLDIATGLYNYQTGERLTTDIGSDLVRLLKIQIEPSSDKLSNPVSINFEDELKLTGYEIGPRRALPGETIDLTLFLKADQGLDVDYTFFAQVVGEDTTRWASHDLAPVGGTSSWSPKETEVLSFSLNLNESTVPGLYPVIVGVYTRTEEGGFDRLQLLTPDGRLTDDFVELTKIRID